MCHPCGTSGGVNHVITLHTVLSMQKAMQKCEITHANACINKTRLEKDGEVLLYYSLLELLHYTLTVTTQ